MAEDNTNNENSAPVKGKETLWIIGAFVLMVVAIITIWQFMLKGKTDEERTQGKDTVMQVKTDTIKIHDSLKTTKEQTHTQNSTNTKQAIDTGKTKLSDKLSEEDKSKIKEKLDDLPKKKQDRIKRKIISNIKK